AMRGITQKTYRERHRPEITQNNRFSRAKPLQTDNRIKLSSPDGQSAHASAAPPGDGIRHGVAFMPGGGCALPYVRATCR
ncbi:TPA: hypothetical protein ACXPYD_005443, partial [Klebsiella variicola subsp. variicola]